MYNMEIAYIYKSIGISIKSIIIIRALLVTCFLSVQFFVGRSDNFTFDQEAIDCFQRNKGTYDIYYCKPLVNDPYFLYQWILVPQINYRWDRYVTLDLNIVDVWIMCAFYGQGVVVVNADDGLDINHPDLKRNYNPRFGYKIVDEDDDTVDSNPEPEEGNSHGTRGAGVIGMEMNNGICGVGVAPEVTLGAVNVWKKSHLIFPWLNKMFEELTNIHIVIHAYTLCSSNLGWTNNEKQVEITNDLRYASHYGNNGRGTLQIFSAGNEKNEGCSCAISAASANIYAIVVAGTTPSGYLSSYSSRCANVMVSAPQGNKKIISTDTDGGCGLVFGGTSASAPIVAGILSLAYNAKPDMTWREAQHLLVKGTITLGGNIQNTFIKNGAGLKVSPDYGFGVINALKIVTLALSFEGVPPLHSEAFSKSMHFSQVYEATGCLGTDDEVMYIEHVQLEIELTYPYWSELSISLYSPSGTMSPLLEKEDKSEITGTLIWTFDSVFSWGESPLGYWTIEVRDVGDPDGYDYEGVVESATLKFYGTDKKPSHY